MDKQTEANLTDIRSDVAQLSRQLQSLHTDVKSLLDAWRAAGFILAVIKFTVTVSAAMLALYGAVKGWFTGH